MATTDETTTQVKEGFASLVLHQNKILQAQLQERTTRAKIG
jgi:hypothetical protein